jgi:hypothetical protein
MIQNEIPPKPFQNGKIKHEVSKKLETRHNYSNPETEIPVNRFRAFYFDDRKPEEFVYSQIVDRPALQHSSRKPVHGIPPKNLIIHWIGYIDVAQKTLKVINIFQATSANSEVLIDDTQIWSGKNYSRSLPYNFSKGRHKIEIRSKTRDHYFSVLVTMTKNSKPIKKEHLSDFLKPFSQADVMYCGVYESENPDMTLPVVLKRKDPFILFLSSYEPVVWELMLQNITHLKAVILSSKYNGSKIINLPDNIPVYHYRKIPWAYSLIPDYNKKFKQTFKYAALEIQSVLGRKPIGFTGAYKLKQANIPERILDETQYREIGLTLAPTNFDIEKLKGSVMDTVFEVSPAITNESKARSWGANINPKNEIPRNAFKAFYFNINRPNSSILTETVEYAEIKYGSLDNRPIPPQNFAGYWVGNWTFPESKSLQLNLSQSNATTRVYVDDKLVYQGGGNPNKGIEFTRGTHKIEVEHVNNWHTVDFLMNLQEKHAILPYEEIRVGLKKQLPGDAKTIYVGVYEGGKNSHSVTVNLKDTAGATFLILNSSNAVKWVLKGPGKDRVNAILLSSQKSKSEVIEGVRKDLPVYHYRLLNAGFRLRPKCNDSHCEGKNFLEMSKDVEFLFQQKISGFTGRYSPDSLFAPETILDKAQYETLENEMAALNRQRDESPELENPDRDKILNQDHVKVAIKCMEYIQRYEYDNFLALLSPTWSERLGDHLKDNFTQLHNSVAGTSIQIDLRNTRKVRVWFVLKRHGKKYGEIRLLMGKYQGKWKVKSI